MPAVRINPFSSNTRPYSKMKVKHSPHNLLLRHGEGVVGVQLPLSLGWAVDRVGWAELRRDCLTPGKGTCLIVPDSKAYSSHVIFVQQKSLAFNALLRRPNTWKSRGGKSWLLRDEHPGQWYTTVLVSLPPSFFLMMVWRLQRIPQNKWIWVL